MQDPNMEEIGKTMKRAAGRMIQSWILRNFRGNENWLGSLVGGQLDDLDFGLCEDMEALDVGGRHLGSQDIQCGLYEDDEEDYELNEFWTPTVVWWTPGVYVSAISEPF